MMLLIGALTRDSCPYLLGPPQQMKGNKYSVETANSVYQPGQGNKNQYISDKSQGGGQVLQRQAGFFVLVIQV